MKRPLAHLRFDARGVATVEFALWAVFLFASMLVAFDFGNFALHQARLERGVSEASSYAFSTRDAIDPKKVAAFVSANSDLGANGLRVDVTCNVGGVCVPVDAGRSCACMSAAGALTPYGCNEPACPIGGKPGYFLTIAAEYTYSDGLFANPLLADRTYSHVSTVKLQ